MNKIRNFIEHAIVMKMSKINICQQEDLDNPTLKIDFDDFSPCHIYFIISLPRIIIVPEKCEFFDDVMKLEFKIQSQFGFEEKSIALRMPVETSKFRIQSDFPFAKFYIYDGDREIIFAKSGLYYLMHCRHYYKTLEAELLYIGQSFGKNGERQSPERLKQHSTLQKIYAEAMQNNPDKEIWLNLVSFDRQLHFSFDGINKESQRQENDIEKSTEIMMKFNKNELNEKQIINFTEASLIKFFKPKYNIIYKEGFPNPNHKSYVESYELDINSVAFEMDTECINLLLYTETIPAKFVNLGSFTLRSKENRKSLFNIVDDTLKPNNWGNISID